MDGKASKAPCKIENVDEFSQQSLRSLMQFIRSSHGLPSAGDDYEFYSSFSGFRDFTLHQRSRLIKNMKALLKNQGLKENFGASTSGINDDDDLTDQLVECNDGIIERVTALLDQKSVKTDDKAETVEPIISIAAPSQQTVVSSWNKVGKTGKSKTFRLFHAYNIMRPQLKFKDTIDNTNAPFLPKISVKPNALRPLPRELIDIQASDKNSESEGHSLAIANLIQQIRQSKEENLAIYDHPYRFEIEQFKPMESQLKSSAPIKYKDIDPETCRLVDKPSDLMDVLSELKSKSVIAVDLEAHSYRSFQGITCLMQLSTREKDYIIDTLALRSELNILNEVFTDPRIVKVFHGADSDIVWLQRDFGIYVVNLFDTGQASRALGLARFSLDFLLTHYCNIQADKKYQLADWRVRPLPKEMLLYAQGDTHYLLYVYDMMKIDLLKAGTGMLEKVHEKSREICLLKYEKAVTTASSHLALMEKQKRRGGKKDFNSQQLEALRLIYAWRDGLARQEDESCGYVLPNHMLLQIAEILPREAQGVLACCNPVPPLLRQHVLAVHQLVLEARNKSLRSDKGGTATVESRVPVPAKTEDDYANLLQCPHDLSFQDCATPNASFKKDPISASKLSDFSITNKSSLLGSFDGGSDEASPKLCRTKSVSTEQDSITEEVKRKLEALDREIWNPFQIFMPTSGLKKQRSVSLGDSNEQITLKNMLSGSFVWKLKKMEGQEEEVETVEEPKTFGKIVDVPSNARLDTAHQTHVLKKLVNEHSRKKVHERSFTAPPVRTGIGEFVPDSWRGGKRGRNSNKTNRDSDDTPKRPFTPHEYTERDYKQFQKKRGGGRGGGRGGFKRRKFKND